MTRLWPQLRAVLVALHVLIVVAMSVPSPEGMSERLLQRESRAFKPWVEALARVGFAPETSTTIILRGGRALEKVEDTAEKLGAPYVAVCGVAQSWRMFSQSPPRGVRVEMLLYEDDRWTRIYANTDPHARWRAGLWEQGRVRGLMRELGNDPSQDWWRAMAETAARRAAADFPDATVFRMQAVPTRSPPPERIEDGLQRGEPRGVTDIPLAPLRGGP